MTQTKSNLFYFQTCSAIEEARTTAVTGPVLNVWMMLTVSVTSTAHKDLVSPELGTITTTTTTTMEVVEVLEVVQELVQEVVAVVEEFHLLG